MQTDLFDDKFIQLVGFLVAFSLLAIKYENKARTKNMRKTKKWKKKDLYNSTYGQKKA